MIRANSRSGRLFDFCNYLFLSILAIVMIFPFVYCLLRSLEGSWESASGMNILPKKWSLAAYASIMQGTIFPRAFLISIIITVLGTLVSLVLTTMLAYALSKKHLIGRRIFTLAILFTFLFNGGIIPTYLVVRNLGMLDNLTALIFPGAMGAFTFFIMRQAFTSIPESLEESAYIDGAGDFFIFWRIYLPLVKPFLAAVSLLYVVRQWNLFFDGILYITSPERWPLQVLVRQTIASARNLGTGETVFNAQIGISPESLQMTAIILSALPMLILYPFFQRSFIAGLTLGAIKE